MLGTKRPASTLERDSTTPTGSKRFKTNRHQSQTEQAPQPPTAAGTAGGWLSGLFDWTKTLVSGSPSARSVAAKTAGRTVVVNNANESGRSRQKPLQQRSIPPNPSFKSLNDKWIWETMTARQRGEPPPAKPRVLEELGMSKEGASKARNGSAKFTTSGLNGNRFDANAGGYQRKKPMGAKEHRLALKHRDDQTLEMLKSMPSTPVEEEQLTQDQDEEFQVYKRGVKSLVEHEDVDNVVKPTRPSNPGRNSSSLLGPPSASYASVVSSSSSSSKKKQSTSTSRPLWKVEQTIEKYRKTQIESPARVQQVFEQFERLRVQQELEEKKALEELEKASAPAVQRKRKWPLKVPREIQDRVSTILKQSGYDKTIPGASVDSKAIKRLRPGTWLDDSIIAFYGVLINNRFLEAEKKGDFGKGEMQLRKVWCFNSFFWNMYEENGYKRVKKWTKKFDAFEKDIIIFPINIRNSHWTCAAVNLKKKRFEYYDSLGNRMKKAHTLLRKWLQEEHECKKGGPIDLSDWEDYWDPNVPQQDNCNDCGVFTCCFMEILSREYEGFDFDHEQMPYLRQKIAYEIDRAELVPEEFE